MLILPSVKNIEEILKDIPFPVNITKGRYSNLEFQFAGNSVRLLHSGVDIKEFPYVWLSSFWGSRDLAYAAKLYLDYFNTPHSFVEKSTSKITDQLLFALNQIPTPDTFYISKRSVSKYVEEIERTCGYPLIIKNKKGSRGKSSVLIRNRAELLSTTSKLAKQNKYLFQRFIQNEYDWGILVANGKVVSAERSYPKSGEFRNHACNGAKEVFVNVEEIPAKVKEMAIKASNLLKLKWSRSDIIVDKDSGTPYLLEVNRTPGITLGTSEVSAARQFISSAYQANYASSL